MSRLPWQLVLVVVLSLAAAVTSAAVLEQRVSYEQGVPLLISYGETADVALMPIEMDGIGRKRIAFSLMVVNHTPQPFDMAEYNITAAVAGRIAQVVRAEELIRSERQRGMWKRIAAGVAGGLAAGYAGANAGRYTEQGRFDGNIYSGRSSTSYQGTYSAHGYDSAAADAVRQREVDRMAGALALSKAAEDMTIENIQQTLLMRTTIAPDEQLIRTIVLEPERRPKPGQRLLMTVVAGHELHRFTFDVAGAGWTAIPSERPVQMQASASPHARPAAPAASTNEVISRLEAEQTSAASPQARPSEAKRVLQSAETIASDRPDPVAVTPYMDVFWLEPISSGSSSQLSKLRVHFSVHWKIHTNGDHPPRQIIGDLIFADNSGSRIRIPWPLPSDSDRLTALSFWEFGTGFELDDQTDVANWLRSITDINKVVRYEIASIND